MAQMTVHCRFFARYAEVLGRDAVDVVVPTGSSVGETVAHVRVAVPGASQLPAHPMAAVNRCHAPMRHVLKDGDELGFLPPLAGG